jgi:outer membrane protein insertion porin family
VLRAFQFNTSVDENGDIVQAPIFAGRNTFQDDPLGGRSYYFGRAELQIPLGSGAQELGLRPSVYVDIGSVFNVVQPLLQTQNIINPQTGAPTFFTVNDEGVIEATDDPFNALGEPNTPALQSQEFFVGDTPSPRLTAGIGVNWNSPFGPFRIDFAYDILSEFGDDTKLITFGVGTQF